MRTMLMCLFVGILGAVLVSCAHGRPAGETGGSASAAATDAQSNEAILLKLVEEHVGAAAKSVDEQKSRVIKRKPYFFKQYDVYPDGIEQAKALVQAQESRSVPWVGDVILAKQRFATRFHTRRNEADTDSNFLRETGTETLTFELRGGRWTRVGSLFVAEKSEENVNGEWVAVKETAKRTPANEERRPGFFKRTWNKILGRSPNQEEPPKKDDKEEDPALKRQRTIQPGRAF